MGSNSYLHLRLHVTFLSSQPVLIVARTTFSGPIQISFPRRLNARAVKPACNISRFSLYYNSVNDRKCFYIFSYVFIFDLILQRQVNPLFVWIHHYFRISLERPHLLCFSSPSRKSPSPFISSPVLVHGRTISAAASQYFQHTL